MAKGVLWLIEAVKKIRPPDNTRVTLLVAGAGGGEEAEQIRAAAAGNERVRFLGALSQDELAKVFRSADVFVLPSMFEGLPLVVIEALACGCLAVVSDLPGMDDWMPSGLCEQGLVERVPMPRLISLDTPDPDAVPAFIEDLAAALTTQLRRAAAYSLGRSGRRTARPVLRRLAADVEAVIRVSAVAGLGSPSRAAIFKASCPRFSASCGRPDSARA